MSEAWKRIQAWAGATVDGVPGPETARRIIAKAGIETDGIPDDYWPLLARIESSNQPYAKAPTSTASGLYQFIRSTWEGEGGTWGGNPSLPFGGLKPTAEEQTARARSFTARNADYLKSKGVPINKATLYAAHFLGPVTAAKVLAASDDARADLLAGPAATKANRRILDGKSVGEFKGWLHGLTGGAA